MFFLLPILTIICVWTNPVHIIWQICLTVIAGCIALASMFEVTYRLFGINGDDDDETEE